MDKEEARRNMNEIINDADNALCNGSLFIEDLGAEAEKEFSALCEALERFRAAVEKA